MAAWQESNDRFVAIQKILKKSSPRQSKIKFLKKKKNYLLKKWDYKDRIAVNTQRKTFFFF